jgi:hypothetical protein
MVQCLVLGGIKKYNGMTPAERAKVDDFVKEGIKLVLKLGLMDAAAWTRTQVHTYLPKLPDSVAKLAGQAVEQGGAALLEEAAKEKKNR